MSDYGPFNVIVHGPYPIWIRVEYSGQSIQFSHKEISDLEHALKQARKQIDHISKTVPGAEDVSEESR